VAGLCARADALESQYEVRVALTFVRLSLELEPVKTLAAITGAGGQQLLNIL